MAYLTSIVRWVSKVGVVISGVFLLGIMILIVSNIIYRFFGHVIPGTYELTGLFAVAAVAFALGYTALQKSHVTIRIVQSRFSPRTRVTSEIITSVISLGTWALVIWASIVTMGDRWLREMSETLEIPYLPFRFVFVLGFIFLFFVILIALFKIRSQDFRK
jgi:TRAP-type C4-dicarboxylate transport system permease small subunit